MLNMAKKQIVISSQRRVQLEQLSDELGVKFNDIRLLDQALTHTSYSNENYGRKNLMNNERLEFLGDAVLETVTSSYLFDRYPNEPEGVLTRMRASAVCENTLSRLAVGLGFDKYILLGKGETTSGGSLRPSNMEDAFEAVIGAVFKDQGWEVAREYVLRHIRDELDHGLKVQDHKSILQELIQCQQQENAIEYKVISEEGPPHAKIFHIAVYVNGAEMGIGAGNSKKLAEQNAAGEALKKYGK